MIRSKHDRRIAAGDPDAVGRWYDEYGRAVFVVAYKALGDRGLAEEAVQQTFLQAWRAMDSFDPEREPGPWLYAIARRAAIDIYRRERRHRTVDEDIEIASLPPSLDRAWDAWQVRLAIDQIPEDERTLMHATHYLGLSHSEIAERLDIPLGTVKSRTHRAHKRLARILSHLRDEASA